MNRPIAWPTFSACTFVAVMCLAAGATLSCSTLATTIDLGVDNALRGPPSCTKNDDCKGDLLCIDGKCKDLRK